MKNEAKTRRLGLLRSEVVQLESIARDHVGVDTLERRGADALDFHDIAVWQLREALEAAYRAGVEAKRR
jgi:hypothetical protein